MSKGKIRTNDLFTDGLGFGALVLICFLYSLFGPYFAEWHIKYSFLSFPIFVGEFLIAFCLLVFALKWARYKFDINRWYFLVAGYFVWVIAKALVGYFEYGPLAFRNAALFYYPIVVLFGYTFFNRKMFTETTKAICLSAITVVIFFKFKGFYSYFWFISLLLFVPLMLSIKNKIIRIIFFVLMVALYHDLFKIVNFSRSHLLGIIVVCFLLGIYFVFIMLKISIPRKIVVICLLILTVLTVMTRFISRGVLESILAPGRIVMLFHEGERFILQRESTFEYEDYKPKLYNRNLSREEQKLASEEKKMRRMARIAAAKRMKENKNDGEGIRIVEVVSGGQTEKEYIFVEGEYKGTAVDGPIFNKKETRRRISYGNIVFRLFIWRDMYVEFKEAKSIFGISFGKPQRSRSLESLRWAPDEWQRDGWITPHNSFFHMIYRGGIVGLFLGLFIYVSILYLIKEFFVKESTPGIFMVTILAYWSVLSNFLVILELPYHAIPFWTLMGVAFAYNRDLKEKRELAT